MNEKSDALLPKCYGELDAIACINTKCEHYNTCAMIVLQIVLEGGELWELLKYGGIREHIK